MRTLIATAACVAALAWIAIGCAHQQGVETQRLPDGTLRIKCQGALPGCLARAEDICHESTYEVLRARDQRDRYGTEFGTAQVEVRSSEAFVRCGSHGRPLEGYEPLTTGTASPNAAPLLKSRACVPGATQACIGPGKCEGGQACLSDGTAFGPCDCGKPDPRVIGPPLTTAPILVPSPAPSGTPTPPQVTNPG